MENIHLWLTPVTVISAVGLLILSTTTRYIDAINSAKSYFGDKDHPEYGRSQFLRAKHIRNALSILYGAVALLSGTIFFAGMADIMASPAVATILVVGTCAAVFLITIAIIILIYETQTSLRILDKTVYPSD